MPKIKTHKGLAKRIKVTKNGKLLRRSARISHLQTNKSKSTKRRHLGTFEIAKADKNNVKKLI